MAEQLLNGRYRVGKLIGHGGMGDVYLGTDTRLGRTVAIKILHERLADTPEFRRRFRTEAMAAARMANPHIVRTYDGNQDHTTMPDGSTRRMYYLVMEYVDGRTVQDILASHGPLEAQEALNIVRQVLAALDYSHRSGIVHRDIKPGNVMLTNTGNVKVMDFGVAHVLGDDSAPADGDKVTGTVQYFAPEQAQGHVTGATTDVYSTGVLLFEMLTGKLPFAGETPAAVAYQHVHEPAPRPSTLVPTLSRAIDLLVLTALQKRPADRYQTADEFAADVDRVQHGIEPLGHAAVPHALLETAVTTVVPVASSSEEEDSPFDAFASQPASDSSPVLERNLRNRRVGIVWGVAGGLALLTVIAFVWLLFMHPTVASPTTKYLKVADVSSLSYADASKQLKGDGFLVKQKKVTSDTVATGTVISTTPVAGKVMAQGSTITINVSSGPKRVAIPSLKNLTQAAAAAKLQAAGLSVGTVTPQTDPTLPEGTVLATSPVSGVRVAPGSSVDLTVSSTLVTIPTVKNLNQADAQKALQAVGLQLNAVIKQDCNQGWQDPLAVQQDTGQVPVGSQVTVTFLQRTSGSMCTPSPSPSPSANSGSNTGNNGSTPASQGQ